MAIHRTTYLSDLLLLLCLCRLTCCLVIQRQQLTEVLQSLGLNYGSKSEESYALPEVQSGEKDFSNNVFQQPPVNDIYFTGSLSDVLRNRNTVADSTLFLTQHKRGSETRITPPAREWCRLIGYKVCRRSYK